MIELSPDHERLAWATAVTLGYVGFCAGLYWRRKQQRKVAEKAAQSLLKATEASDKKPVLIGYATQTGFAETLAWRTAETLIGGNLPVQVLPLSKVDKTILQSTDYALFIVSTTGEGDAPDSSAGFTRRIMSDDFPLGTLHYGLLALGDRSYTQYCAFGHSLDAWLRHQAAQPMFDMVDVDNGDDGALRHWQYHLARFSGNDETADWSSPPYERWRLNQRSHLNPGSPGDPAFHLSLVPIGDNAIWQAGDIAEIGPQNAAHEIAFLLDNLKLNGHDIVNCNGEDITLEAFLSNHTLPHDSDELSKLINLSAQQLTETLKPLPHREYSIASISDDGQLDLLIRQMHYPDGRLGIGSGWLTEHAAMGSDIALRIRQNKSFHAPSDDCPLILIGNGTGLAGLRSHIKERAARGKAKIWLIFGERTVAHDFFHQEEIETWQRRGVITRLDLAFSRDQDQRIYVQDRIRDAAADIRSWANDGAAIYVCGSLQGMAEGVHKTLTDILGQEQLETMSESGRYCRDVY